MRAAVVVFALCAVACLAGHIAILRSVVRSRSATADSGVPRPKLAIEILWALVPAVALLILLASTWPVVERNTEREPGVVMQVVR